MVGYRSGLQRGRIGKAEKEIAEWDAAKCLLEREDPVESVVGGLEVADSQDLAADLDTVLPCSPGNCVTQVVAIDGKNDRIEMAVADRCDTRDAETGKALED